MRVLVTGGAGFIGSHLSDALLGAGHDVCIVDDLSTGHRHNVPGGARFEHVDIRDRAALQSVFADFEPECVSHQAAQTSVAVSTRDPILDASINVLGLIEVLTCAVAHGVNRVVFASSGGTVYGDVDAPRSAAVGDPTHPLSPYGSSKLAGEHYLATFRHEHGLSYAALRYANVYGPRQDPHGEAGVVAIFCRKLLAGDPLQINAMHEAGDPGCVRDYVYVDDVVAANVAALEGRLDTASLNVCTGVASTTLDVARGLQSALGIETELRYGPRRAGDLRRSVLDPGPLTRALGAPTRLVDGLARTAEWFRSSAS